MSALTEAGRELFRRSADETFASLDNLAERCRRSHEESDEIWQPLAARRLSAEQGGVALQISERPRLANDWSFSQLCRLAGVQRETINRLRPATAAQALDETLPRGTKPMQMLVHDERLRSVHGTSYTRLWDDELLEVVREAAPGFGPPPAAVTGGTGLYRGEQDMFCFLVDPEGWVEVDGEAFAPGFFVWNSEVGRRTLGLKTFWYQRICGNHIVWDVREVEAVQRRHTSRVREGLDDIRNRLGELRRTRDERRDGFAATVKKAMTARLGRDAEEIVKVLLANGLPRNRATAAVETAGENGPPTLFAIVDALTRASQASNFAASRTERDVEAASLLALAS